MASLLNHADSAKVPAAFGRPEIDWREVPRTVNSGRRSVSLADAHSHLVEGAVPVPTTAPCTRGPRLVFQARDA
jgi:hypothetical protein